MTEAALGLEGRRLRHAASPSVVGGYPAAKEIWIVADGNSFAPGGKTVFLRLEPVGALRLAA